MLTQHSDVCASCSGAVCGYCYDCLDPACSAYAHGTGCKQLQLQLHVGDRVILTGSGGHDDGQLTGVVSEIDGHVAVITPDSEALRAWLPNGYRLGSAHWPARVRLIST
jgi:hypothetical protein